MSSAAIDSTRDKPKRNGDVQSDIAGRDKPLFMSRRPLQEQEFFTDSLNSSFIPKPSPPKKGAATGVGARPRRTLGGPRTLRAAFEATGDATDENRPQSSSSSEKTRPEQTSKPRPAQTNGRPLPETAKAQRHRSTPSPRRGRSAATLTPSSSASSPPRGLAEAYQRILDEEDLAAQEGEPVDDLTGDPYQGTNQGDPLEKDRKRVERIRDSASPVALKTSRRRTPRISGKLEEIAAAEAEEMRREDSMDDSEGSSSVNFLDNATDDSFGRALMEHAKDQHRVNSVLKSDGHAFRKARVGERVGLTVENLRRNNGSHQAADKSSNGTEKGSVNSDRSEPPVNIPRDWGRKATGGKDWLSRINSKSGRGRLTGDSPKLGKDRDPIVTNEKPKHPAEEEVDWISAAAEVPLPSVDTGSSPGASLSRASTPTSTQRRNSSLDKIQEWEMNDDDFTARSLQISNSPPIKIKNSTLNSIREREIESLERRAVTTSRLGEIREKKSKEQLRGRAPSVPIDEPKVPVSEDKTRSRRRSSTPSKLEQIHLQAIPTDEGEQIPNTPITIYRGTISGAVRGSEGSGSSDGDHKKQQRPSHGRHDSHGLLRQLARASSASVSPSPAKGTGDQNEEPTSEVEDKKGTQTEPRLKRTNSNEKKNWDVETVGPRGSDPTAGGELQDKDKTTPQAPRQSAPLKTPLVTGAWVDTPLPTGGRGPPLPTPADIEDVRDLTFRVDEELSRLDIRDIIGGSHTAQPHGRTTDIDKHTAKANAPEKVKSALAVIIDEAKGKAGTTTVDDDDLPLGEDTIRSLEELIADDTDICTLLSIEDDEFSTIKPEGRALTLNERERQKEMVRLERMNTRLKALGLSIHDAKRGISKLAQQVCNEGGEFHDFIWPCPKCACPGGRNDELDTWRRGGGDGELRLSIPIPRLWRWRTGDRPRLTWLGLFTLLGWGWFIAEFTV
ncbi:hypothetical protein MMC16_000220, partial [Acarospora aff. strigata]|nr:hypothetical protein [Acarospora aff. strigata]